MKKSENRCKLYLLILLKLFEVTVFFTMYTRELVYLLVPTRMEDILIIVSLFPILTLFPFFSFQVSSSKTPWTLLKVIRLIGPDGLVSHLGFWWFTWVPRIQHARSYRIDGCKDNCFMSWSSSDRFSRRDGEIQLEIIHFFEDLMLHLSMSYL